MLLTNQSFSQQAWWFSSRERPTFGDETRSIASYCFQFFFSCQHRTTGVLCELLWFFRVCLDILCINWVLNAFMCIIQIWTTCTCSSAYKLVETQICVLGCMLRSHARNGNEFQTPWHRWLPAKQWDAWFLNTSKSEARLKFMKLGMLSWSGINMPWYKFYPIWGRFG